MGAMSKLPGRHGMTTTASHPHNPWSQFCGLPLSKLLKKVNNNYTVFMCVY